MYKKIYTCYLLLIWSCVSPHIGLSSAAALQDDFQGSNSRWIYQKGTVQLLIARPNDLGETGDTKSYWLPSIAEAFFYFRMDAISSLEIIPLEDISKELPFHRRFGTWITKEKYVQIAEKLHATHVLYWEFEAGSAKEWKCSIDLEPVNQSGKSFRIEATVAADDITGSLDRAITELIAILGLSARDIPVQFFTVDILGAGEKSAQRTGKCIMQGEGAAGAALLEAAQECETIISDDATMYIAYVTAYRFYLKAGDRAKAITVYERLYNRLKDLYPKLALQLMDIYRTEGEFDKAEKVLSRLEASGAASLYTILWERGLLYEAAGNMESALAVFNKLKDIYRKSPETHFYCAKILMALGRASDADNVITETVRLSRMTKGEIYRRLGEEFLRTGNTAFAILAFKKSLHVQVDNQAVWHHLAELYTQSGNDSAAAICYMNLYKLDNIKNKGYLKKACALYESSGQTEKARKAYEQAYEKENDPVILIMLAELEYRQKDCKRVRTLLNSLTGALTNDRRVKDLLEKCIDDTEPPFITLKGKNPMVLLADKDQYREPGAIAVDNVDGDLTSKIKITGNVDTHILDTFTITYTVSDSSENSSTKTRTIIVVDTVPPRITLLGNSPFHLRKGDTFTDPGVTAADNRDGDISSSVTVEGTVNTSKAGNYIITYRVSDRAGNQAIEKRFVNVYGSSGDFDTTAPVIVAFNEPPEVIAVGDSYLMPQVKAFDDKDGDITSLLTAWGRVDTSFPGVYAITFSASDKSGNVGKKTFTVTVLDPSDMKKLVDKKVPADMTAAQTEKEKKKALINMEPDWVTDVSIIETPGGKKNRKQQQVNDDKRGVSTRKIALSITTGVLGAGFGVFGLVMNARIPERQTAYDAADQSDVNEKRSELERTGLLRNIGYIGAGVCGLGFTINIAIPDMKQRKMSAVE